jgi:hypothetical protein
MPDTSQRDSARFGHRRAGITIIEVLTAMVVAMIGVFGVMILIPFAVKQAEVGLDLDDARRQAENGIAQFQISGFERLVENPAFNDMSLRPLWIDTNGNQILFPDAYAIDPLSIFANDPANGYDRFPPSFSIAAAGFDPAAFPFIGELNLADYNPDAANVNDVVRVWSGDQGEAMARRMFRNTDDLVFGDALSDLEPPQQIFDADAAGDPVGRQARGEMSWMSILVPSFDADNPTGSAWKYRMFVLAFKDRALQTTGGTPGAARFPIAAVANRGVTDQKDVGFGGGNVRLVRSDGSPATISGVRKDDWVLLINENPDLPAGFRKQIGFFRVIATFEDTMTLDGPDFVFNRLNSTSGSWEQLPTYAVHLANFDAASMANGQLNRLGQVVSVFERTFVWEFGSEWNR